MLGTGLSSFPSTAGSPCEPVYRCVDLLPPGWDGRFPCGGVSGLLLGRLRRPGVPPRGLRLVYRLARSPGLLLLELFASFKFRVAA